VRAATGVDRAAPVSSRNGSWRTLAGSGRETGGRLGRSWIGPGVAKERSSVRRTATRARARGIKDEIPAARRHHGREEHESAAGRNRFRSAGGRRSESAVQPHRIPNVCSPDDMSRSLSRTRLVTVCAKQPNSCASPDGVRATRASLMICWRNSAQCEGRPWASQISTLARIGSPRRGQLRS
jgi:hypothetical protein